MSFGFENKINNMNGNENSSGSCDVDYIEFKNNDRQHNRKTRKEFHIETPSFHHNAQKGEQISPSSIDSLATVSTIIENSITNEVDAADGDQDEQDSSCEPSSSASLHWSSPIGKYMEDVSHRLYSGVEMSCQPISSTCANLGDDIRNFNCQQISDMRCFPFLRHQYNDPKDVYTNNNARGLKSNECEYCKSVVKCRRDCQRPSLFLQKKRPPFANDDEFWDEYDYPVIPPQRQISSQELLYCSQRSLSYASSRTVSTPDDNSGKFYKNDCGDTLSSTSDNMNKKKMNSNSVERRKSTLSSQTNVSKSSWISRLF
eukprot:CAMPEP_0178947358 /NCGR_PEP_ID=MMETSP0789-20121207/4808_1 /TAXON_ID=3005 /ORGANISM="Rhizosolenia setigera, Strain CCMP 1694" /LENGTH=314 /DNA_ID=CAMNT_0020627475 /DNA_START=16 /DNA_END=960 /DNA_ORIENTATION=-